MADLFDIFNGSGLLSAHTADSGDTWSDSLPSVSLSGSGKAYPTNFSEGDACFSSWTPPGTDYAVSIVVGASAISSGAWTGMLLRLNGSPGSQNYYFFQMGGPPNVGPPQQYYIAVCLAGTASAIVGPVDFVTPVAAGDTMTLAVSGAGTTVTLQLYQNGTLIATGTDTTTDRILTAGAVGIRIASNTGGTDFISTLWAGAIGGPTETITPSAPTVAFCGTQSLTAAVQLSGPETINWAATSGTITGSPGPTVTYTAPGSGSSDTVTWTSADLPTHQASAAVTLVPPTGAHPYAGLALDSGGNLYGATISGQVFKVASGTNVVTVLATFSGADVGCPYGALVLDGSGNIFTTTARGGSSGVGSVFEVVNGSGVATTLASLNGINGTAPYGRLLLAAGGDLYGTTTAGGRGAEEFSLGTVFKIAAGSGVITTLATLPGWGDGGYCFALGGLAMDGSGNLFGTALFGGLPPPPPPAPFVGSNCWGTVFEVVAGSGVITTLAYFDDTTGANPFGGVVLDAGGNLYGTTLLGGSSGCGTVFMIASGSGTVTTLASFNGSNGKSPYAGLLLDSAGNLFGVTAAGGSSGLGTVFKVANGSGTITTLATFNGTNGATPIAGLVMDSGGTLFGTTVYGGSSWISGPYSGSGTVFSVASGGGTITTLFDFAG